MDNLIRKLLVIVLLIIAANAYSWDRQKVIGAPNSSLDGSSIFEVVSTTKGSTPSPKMTTGNRTAISTPDEGLHAWDTSLNIPYAYDGSSWDQFLLATATQILTNKTFDADLNTLTNVENADIKSLAGIDATKIHDGSTDNTEFGYLDGVTSSIQTQIDSKLGSSGFSGDRLLFTNASGAVDSSSDATYTKTTQILRILGHLTAGGRGEFRSEETTGGNYVGFRAPDVLAGNQIWTLPATDGTADFVLATDGSGTFYFKEDATGDGGGTGTMVTKSASTTLATTGEERVACAPGASDITLTLPSSTTSLKYEITMITDGVGDCFIVGTGAEEIDGTTDAYSLRHQFASAQFSGDGSDYFTTALHDGKVTHNCYIDNSGGTPLLDSDSGLCEPWISSVTDDGVGNWTPNFIAGTFSKVPICHVTALTPGRCAMFDGVATTSNINIHIKLCSDNTDQDHDVFFSCTGVR